jgi:CRP/FNR family cyclic AMP-dependent transcriptional regulator
MPAIARGGDRVTVAGAVSVDIALIDSASRWALFADLSQPELEALLPNLEEASFGEGQWVTRRGDFEPGLFIIVDGEVSVVLEGEELAALTQGSFFGEISALIGEPVVADIIARTPLRCFHVPPDGVEDFLISNPKVMYRMLQQEARRLRTTDELRT